MGNKKPVLRCPLHCVFFLYCHMSKRSFRICSISAFRDAVFLLVVQPSISPAEEQRTQLFLFLSCRPVSIFRTFVTSAAGVKVLISVSLWIRRVVPYRRKGKHCVPVRSRHKPFALKMRSLLATRWLRSNI